MSRRRNQLTQWVLLGTFAVASGLDARAQPPAGTDRHDTAAVALRDISGTWEGTFRLDSAWRLPEPATARSVHARLRFDPVGNASPPTSRDRSVHAGSFEIDFSRLGFTLSTREALGWSVSADSMRATLNPTVDHGFVEVHGAFRGETIVGTWRYVADPGGAAGTFEVTRTSSR
jgi:hypothetical protein